MERYSYHGYSVSRNGHIYNFFNEPVPIKKDGTVKLTYNGKKHVLSAGRIVYEAVTGTETGRRYVIEFIDGDPTNCSFSNIRAIPRKEYFQGKEWSTQKLSPAEKENIGKIYYDGEHGYTQIDLANKFGVSLNLIEKILKTYREKHGIKSQLEKKG